LYAKNRFAGRLLTSHFSPEYTTPETWRNSTTTELLHHGQDGRSGVRVPDSFKEPFPKLSGEKINTPKKARPKSWKIGWNAVLRTLAMCYWSVNEQLVGGFNPIRKILVKWESSPNRGENKKSFFHGFLDQNRVEFNCFKEKKTN